MLFVFLVYIEIYRTKQLIHLGYVVEIFQIKGVSDV
jgi:hypothetical protein